MERLWHLCCEAGNNDLAWRTATILYGRKALSNNVERAWTISGENRAEYPFYKPELKDFERCINDLPSEEKRLSALVL